MSGITPHRDNEVVIDTGSDVITVSIGALIDNFECQIRDICETYSRVKVFISLLLPTRVTHLNYRIRDLNNSIKDMTCRLSRVSIIEH